MEINLATYAVRVDGVVDTDATMEKFAADLDTYIAERQIESETISNAVNGVFDDLKGVRVNVPFVVSSTLQRLNVAAHPAMYATLAERVHSFLSDNSQGKTDKATGAVERPNSLFVIGKGKGGGIGRRADLPVAAATDSK
jgi:hypothetical protein